MAAFASFLTGISPTEPYRIRRILTVNRFSGDEESAGVPSNPAEEFSTLALTFRRRLLVGATSCSFIALGANFAGVTSTLLGILPESGRNLRLDVLYPIQGYSRCWDPAMGFEFLYPATWVGDQRLLYRAAGRGDLERSLDPPPLGAPRRKSSGAEPVAAFGPPGSSGELNVSIIVTTVPPGFAMEAFGGPTEVGESLVKKISGSSRSGIAATLISSSAVPASQSDVMYYILEFKVESPSFRRHNVAVCIAHNGKLYTLNAQTPESEWPTVRNGFYEMVNSFRILDVEK